MYWMVIIKVKSFKNSKAFKNFISNEKKLKNTQVTSYEA